MALEQADFDSVTEDDLQELVTAQVPEGLRLDYKLKEYGNRDKDKLELNKDVSAFANSSGGHLVIGIEEAEGVASSVLGVDIDADAEILRIESILRHSIDPPISGIRVRAIPLKSGNKAIVLRIPRSWNLPHRVTFKGKNRFYLRHSAGVHEPSMVELRAMFNHSSVALEKAQQFRDDRINTVVNGEGQRPLVGGGRLFLHIIPVAAFSGMVNINVAEAYDLQMAFRPLSRPQGMSPGYNFHGFINERGGSKNHGYTQVFRNGCVEATKANIIHSHGQTNKVGKHIEDYIFYALPPYVEALKALGVPAPLIVMVTLQGVEGALYIVDMGISTDEIRPLPLNKMNLPECVIEDYGTMEDYHRSLRPAFDALWNAVGYHKAHTFNSNGVWTGEWNR